MSSSSNTVLPSTDSTFHPANVVAAPTSTLLGLGMWANQIASLVASGGMPTTIAGWLVLALSGAGGLAGIFGR